jgi:hypothetical protein
MINFLLGFILADFLFSLTLYLKKDIFSNFNQENLKFVLLVDILLIIFLLVLKYGKFKRS